MEGQQNHLRKMIYKDYYLAALETGPVLEAHTGKNLFIHPPISLLFSSSRYRQFFCPVTVAYLSFSTLSRLYSVVLAMLCRYKSYHV